MFKITSLLKKTKISNRLICLVLVTILCILINGLFFFYIIEKNNAAMDMHVKTTQKEMILSLQISNAVKDLSVSVRNIALLDEDAALEKEWDHYKSLKEKLFKLNNELKSVILHDHSASQKEKDFFHESEGLLSSVSTFWDEAVAEGMKNNNAKTIEIIMNQSYKIASVLSNRMYTLSENFTTKNADENNFLITENKKSQLAMIIAAVLILMVVSLMSYIIINSINKQLGGELADVQALAMTIAKGDLTSNMHISADDTDSLSYSLKEMQKNLKELIIEIHSMSESITVASSEIADGNTELSSRTEEQAAALQQTSSSMEQISITTKENHDNAKNAANIVQETTNKINHGNNIVASLLNTMNDISSSSSKVSDVIGIIESIAFQTNILALNAAVEAARAGENGRGFAVVANEVRNLAQRCAKETKEIDLLVKQSIDNVKTGTRVSNEINTVFSDITVGADKASVMINHILLASEEQEKGISQISVAINQLDSVTQQNAALVQQSSGATQSMAEQTNNLLSEINKFNIGSDKINIAGNQQTIIKTKYRDS